MMILNLGSTSYKFKLYIGTEAETDINEQEAVQGEFENIGSDSSHYQIIIGGHTIAGERPFQDHLEAFHFSLEIIKQYGVMTSLGELTAVGYKTVLAGEISGTRIIEQVLIDKMVQYLAFAPVHNRVYIKMIIELMKDYPQLCQIAAFETEFHQSIPRKRRVYGVPAEWQEQIGIRKYGFHGASHSYNAWKLKQINEKAHRIISIHLGGSSSICAIKDGQSIATSMGATPQSGLLQNNRIGEFDIFCLPALMKYYDNDWQKIMQILAAKSGLLGLSQCSNDMRQIIQAAGQGDQQALLAVEAYVDQIVGYIGMYYVYLKGLDAIVFTGGIGTGSAYIRKRICAELKFMGISLDDNKNENNIGEEIAASASEVGIYRWKTNEELMVLRRCLNCLHHHKACVKDREYVDDYQLESGERSSAVKSHQTAFGI